MATLAQNVTSEQTAIIAPISFSILDNIIRIVDGLYSLNDLHKASGNDEKHKPVFFLRNQQTKDLIAEIDSENLKGANSHLSVKTVKGTQGGTYVCRELVYGYAMWISAKFHLMVIRAFDAMYAPSVEQAELPAPRPYQMPLPTMSDKRTRVPVKDAVTLLVAKSRNMNYSEAYGMIHQRFNVDSVEDLTNEQLPQVIEYIHKVVCEFIGKAELPAPKTQNILAETLQSITIMQGQVDYWQVRDALKQLTAILNQYQPYAHVRHVVILLETIERMMMRLWSMIDEAKQHASIFHSVFKTGKPLTTSNMDTLVSMESLLSRNMMVLQMPQYQNI